VDKSSGSPINLVPDEPLALIDITGGTPGSDVNVNGEWKGRIDVNGNLKIPVEAGWYTVAISKQGYETKEIKDIRVSHHLGFPNASLTPTQP